MLESLLATYGYPVILIGSFLEGETVMILGGVAAHLGYLSLDWIILCGFAGTFFGDQLYFILGRRHGKKLLARFPSWQPRSQLVFQKLQRHQNLLILSFRFLYGLRSVTPFAIGMSNVFYLRFAILNVIGAAVWASSTAFAGYYFGRVVEAVLGDIKHYEVEFMSAILGVAIVIWAMHFYRRRVPRTGPSKK